MKEFYEKCGRKFGEYEKSNYLCIAFEMVDVAQWLEHRIVVPGVVGSTPIFHPSVSKGIAYGQCLFCCIWQNGTCARGAPIWELSTRRFFNYFHPEFCRLGRIVRFLCTDLQHVHCGVWRVPVYVVEMDTEWYGDEVSRWLKWRYVGSPFYVVLNDFCRRDIWRYLILMLPLQVQ